VFAGIAMFGAWGIVIGPVLMIVIVTTISVYLAVYKDVPMEVPEDDEKPTQRKLLGWFARRRGKNKPAATPVKPAAP
jgi:hypothetical protein